MFYNLQAYKVEISHDNLELFTNHTNQIPGISLSCIMNFFFYRYISSSCTQHSRMWSINGSRLEKSSYWCHTYECWFFQVLLLLIAFSPIVFLEYLQWVLLFASFLAFWRKEAKSGCLMLSSFTHPSLKYRL